MDVLTIFSVIFLSLLLAMAGASAGLKAALYLMERRLIPVHNRPEKPGSTDPRR